MGFHFAFDTLLQHRKRLEEEAQRDYFEAQNNVNQALNEIQKMYARIEEIRLENAELERSQNINKLGHITSNNEFIEGQKIKIERKRYEARELMQIAEEKQEKLIDATKEHKILEKLKEKQYSAYRERLRKKERKQIDDIVTMRAKRGSA